MAEPNHAGFHNELRLTARELTLRIMICPPGMICAAAHKGAIQFMECSEKSCAKRNSWRSQIMPAFTMNCA